MHNLYIIVKPAERTFHNTFYDGNTERKPFAINGYPPEWTLYQLGELIGDLYREREPMESLPLDAIKEPGTPTSINELFE